MSPYIVFYVVNCCVLTDILYFVCTLNSSFQIEKSTKTEDIFNSKRSYIIWHHKIMFFFTYTFIFNTVTNFQVISEYSFMHRYIDIGNVVNRAPEIQLKQSDTKKGNF